MNANKRCKICSTTAAKIVASWSGPPCLAELGEADSKCLRHIIRCKAAEAKKKRR